MNRRNFLLMLIAWAASSCDGRGVRPTLDVDLAAIDRVREEHVRGVNATDPDLVMSGMTDDVVYLGPGMDPLLGATALRGFIEPLYQQIRPAISMVPKDLQVVGDVAYEWGVISGSAVMSPGGPALPMNAKYVYVYRRQPDGSWRIVYDIYNENAPLQPVQ